MTTTQLPDQGYRGLSQPAARLYEALAGCPAHYLDAAAVAALAGCTPAEAYKLAVSLVEAGLARRAPAPGGAGLRITLDAAGHIHAAAVTAEPPDADALDRWIDHLIGCAALVDCGVDPAHRRPFPDWRAPKVKEPVFTDSMRAGVPWLREQLPNYMALIRWGLEHGRFDLAYTIAQILWPLWLWLRPAETREALELGLAAAAAGDDAQALDQMRMAVAGQLRLEPVDLRRAYELDRAAKASADERCDEQASAQAADALGWDALAAGSLTLAQEMFTIAERLSKALDDLRGAGSARRGLALVEAVRGQLHDAARQLAVAHTTLQESGDVFDTLMVLAEIGVVRARLGELGQGLAALDQARVGLELAGADHGQILVLRMQAATLRAAGRSAAAAKAQSHAARLLAALDPAAAARLREAA